MSITSSRCRLGLHGCVLVTVLLFALAPGANAQGDPGLADVLRNLPTRIPFPSDLVQTKSAVAARSTRIDPALLALADEVISKGPAALPAVAGAYGVGVRGDLVAVELIAESIGEVDALARRVRESGGFVSATFESVLLAEVPVDMVERFEDEDALYYMTPQTHLAGGPPVDAVGSVRDRDPRGGGRVSAGDTEWLRAADGGAAMAGGHEGVRAINAERLHEAGVTGREAAVGVLDFGFQDYAALVRSGRLPPAAAQRAFNDSGTVENGNRHGTACAEIVHAVAPDARLFLAAVDGRTDQVMNAAWWLAEQGVDIINFSGGTPVGPHDGTALLDRFVDDFVDATGIVWVNAAGNYGAQHWGGPATDRDRDGVIEIGGDWPGIAVRPADAARGIIDLVVIWDDWGADPSRPSASQDIDAFLFAVDERTQELELVAEGASPQRGRGEPVERVRYQDALEGQPYVLLLRATRLTRPANLHVYSLAPGTMEPTDPSGSLEIPATARGALAVGAVDVTSGQLALYSAHGPPDDERLKPELSAPANTRSLAYGTRFSGTSAAAPHVAGFLALLIKRILVPSAVDWLQQVIRRHVRRIFGQAGPNNRFGYGHIDASNVDVSSLVGIDSPPAPGIGLPEFLGGPTTLRTMDALWERGARQVGRLGLRVRVNQRPGPGGSPPLYRIGDPMKVGVATDERCRYALVHRDARGRYALLSPEDAPILEPGEPRLLPEGRGENLTIGEPVGDEGFMLVCARRPVDLDAWAGAGASRDVDVATTAYRVER